jgi:hypothetical protein
VSSRFFIKTTDSTSIINGDYMTVHGDYLFVYAGEELVGMFRSDAIIDAHKTEKG